MDFDRCRLSDSPWLIIVTGQLGKCTECRLCDVRNVTCVQLVVKRPKTTLFFLQFQ